MCYAFSAWVSKTGDVFWRAGLDSHDEISSAFTERLELRDDGIHTPLAARIEITPTAGYLHPDEPWRFCLDERDQPAWWADTHEMAAWRAFEQWKAEVYSKVRMTEALSPVNPFQLTMPTVTEQHLRLLREWASVGDSVWTSVRASVWTSVGDSVVAYIGSLFDIWQDGYRFQSAADLWRCGLVSSYDGVVWRLHGGPDAKVLWQGTFDKAA